MKIKLLIASLTIFMLTGANGCSVEDFLNSVKFKVFNDGETISIEGEALPAETVDLYNSLWIGDLHSDSLLWTRNLTRKSNSGHIDIPRAEIAKINFFVASTVSKVPLGLNGEINSGDSDLLTLKSIAEGLPSNTWFDPYQRTRYQLNKMNIFESRIPERVIIIKNLEEFQSLIDNPSMGVGVLLATEGAHAIQGDLAKLDNLYDLGLRMMGLTHFFDNAVGGSAHGEEKGGLTEFGAELVQRMEEKGIIVDLAHGSEALFTDVFAIATRPILVSHTGIRGTCDRTRNLSDAQLMQIKDNNGLVGIGFFELAICDVSYQTVAETIKYVADLIGVEHVALGSDYDGTVETPTDITGLAFLTQELIDIGFSNEEIAAIMGENMKDFFLRALR